MDKRFWTNKKVLITGGAGFLGTYVTKLVKDLGGNVFVPRSKEYDLRDKYQCRKAVRDKDIVIHLAAKVGGIGYNLAHPAEMFYDNILMGVHLIEEAKNEGVKKFVLLGTICAYPKFTPVPFNEDNLWNGYPEETNAPYGIAKKALLVQAQSYKSQYNFNIINLLPVNLYGPGDKFDPQVSHVIPAIIRKTIEAKEKKKKELILWGTGRATREFLYVEDAAKGIILATEKYNKAYPVNLGSGKEISIRELAEMITQILGFKGKIIWDTAKPDGQPRRRLDTTRAQKEFGFTATTKFEKGLKKTIDWYLKNKRS